MIKRMSWRHWSVLIIGAGLTFGGLGELHPGNARNLACAIATYFGGLLIAVVAISLIGESR
jgi:hypothetical protein